MNHGSERRNKDTKGRSVSIIQDKRMRKKVVMIKSHFGAMEELKFSFCEPPTHSPFMQNMVLHFLPDPPNNKQMQASSVCFADFLTIISVAFSFLLSYAPLDQTVRTPTRRSWQIPSSLHHPPFLSTLTQTCSEWLQANFLLCSVTTPHLSSFSPSPYITGWAIPQPTNQLSWRLIHLVIWRNKNKIPHMHSWVLCR